MSGVSVVHDSGGFLLSSFRDRDEQPAPILETEARIERIVAGLRSCPWVRWATPPAGNDQALDILRRMHAAEYLGFLAEASARVEAEVWDGRYSAPGIVPDTPVTPGAFDAAVRACSSAVAAANLLVEGERHTYAVCRPPGHHAGRAFMGGYCYLNNAAAAAWARRDAGRRVGVVDVDYHHGNGTADVLGAEPDIPFVSLHASTLQAFPYVATAPRSPSQWFVPFDTPPSEDEYLARLDEHLRHLTAVDAIVVSLGYDLVGGDPHGGWTMTPGFFRLLARTFREPGRPLCFVQEGGYAVDRLAECSRELALGLE